MTQRIQAAIVGTGFMGSVHARAVMTAGGRVRLVVGSSPGRARKLAEALPGAEPAGFEEALASGVDVVHLCVPNHLHHDMARRALAAASTWSAKSPVRLRAGGGRPGLLAARTGRVATVPFVYRFYPRCGWRVR
ncbi:Gfo/Idh/MocA family oxidoreductase [Streptomyces nogalater]